MTIIERYERNEILRSMEETLFNYWRSILLRDHKELVEELFSDIPNDSFDRMMYYFETKSFKDELDNRIVAKAIYEKLGWCSGYYDVINSFWTTYTGALVSYCEKNSIKCSKLLNSSKSEWNYIPFAFSNGSFKVRYKKGDSIDYHNMTKHTLASKLVNPKTIYAQVSKKMISDMVDFDTFASLSHCVANFTLCPEPPFNMAKGTAKAKITFDDKSFTVNLTNDYLPLMIDLIQKATFDEDSNNDSQAKISFKCKTESDGEYKEINNAEVFYYNSILKKDQPITKKMIQKWRDWFLKIENRMNYFLEDYYIINEKSLQGIALFKKQSLSYPIPKTAEDCEECIKNIVDIINRRADSMAKRIINKMKYKETCEDIWA